MNTLLRLLLPVLLLAGGSSAFGQEGQTVTKVGTTAAKFLSIPVSARAVAMGGAFAAIANDASAMYWNPAGISLLYQSEAMFSHSAWIADISFNYGGIVLPVEGLGSIGFNFTSLSMDDMERTTIAQPDGTGEYFSAGMFAIGLSYGRRLTEWFSIGANAKYIYEGIWNTSATGFAIDFGTLFTTPFDGLKFGAGVSNFGTRMRMTGDDLLVQKDISPNAGNNPNINANLTTEYFELPLALRIGFAYEPLVSDDHVLTLVADATYPSDNSESVSLGVEYQVFNRILALRAGYRSLGLRDGEERMTAGAGVSYPVSADLRVKFDYAFQQFVRLDNVHTFTMGVVF